MLQASGRKVHTEHPDLTRQLLAGIAYMSADTVLLHHAIRQDGQLVKRRQACLREAGEPEERHEKHRA